MPVSRFSDSESDAEGTDRSAQLSSESGEVGEADGRKARVLAGVQGQMDDDWIRLLGQQSHITSVPSTWLKTCNSAPPTLTQASALSTYSERFSECGSYFDLDSSSSGAASVTSRSDTTTVPNDSPGYFNISSPYDSDDEGCQTKPKAKGEPSSDQRGLLLQPPRPPRRRPISGSPSQATIVKRPPLLSHASYPAPATGNRPLRRPKLLSHATFPRPTKSAEPDVFGGHCGEARPNISKLAQQSSLHASWKLQDSSFLQGDSTDDEDEQMDGNATARRLRRTRNASSASSRRNRELSGLGLGFLQCDEENRKCHWSSTQSRGLASPVIPQRPFPPTRTQGHRALTPPRRPVLTRQRSITVTVKVDDSTGGLLPPLRYSVSTNSNNNAKDRGSSSSSSGGGGEHDDCTFVKTPTLTNGSGGSGSCDDARAVSTGEQHVYAYWV
ncbi:unnamed protein product [Jaminaea pallidilutea]